MSPQSTRGALVIAGLTVSLLCPGLRAAGGGDTGLWVRRTTLVSPEAIDSLVEEASAAGFSTLLVETPHAPFASTGTGGRRRGRRPQAFDGVETLLTAAHRHGLRVHAWVQATLVARTGDLATSSSPLVRQHPGWLMVPRELAVELARLDVNDPAYVEMLDQWARQHPDEVEGLYQSPLIPSAASDAAARLAELLKQYRFDGVHLDSTQFPSSDFDYGRDAVGLFRDEIAPSLGSRERLLLDGRAAIDPLTYPDAFPAEWSRFRRSRVTALVARLGSVVRRHRPEARVGVSVVADPDEAYGRRLQDWRTWAELGFIDIACLQPGFESGDDFERQLRSARQRAGGADLWAGIGARWLSPLETFDRIRTAHRLGTDGIMVWSYESVTDPTRQPPGHLQQIGLALATVPTR
ncbi:MAG: family 10 glycosylhydrolase [Vicinamibacterales bacterium]|nr:family 10 glycosylhydrolase [Vicinamibacterales bacterium]